jgi:hypothetical protein
MPEPTFSITAASHTLILATSTTRPKLLYQLKLHTSKCALFPTLLFVVTNGAQLVDKELEK